MPTLTYKDYLIQACINEGLVFELNKNHKTRVYFNWIFVALFYSALHYFYAFLSFKGKEIPRAHKSRNDDVGAIDKAKDLFFTSNNNITDSAGADYQTLFDWSCDARYKPDNYKFLSDRELRVAINSLEGIKLVAYNEIGYMPCIKNKKLSIKAVSQAYLQELYNKRQAYLKDS